MRYVIFSIMAGLALMLIWPALVRGSRWLARQYLSMMKDEADDVKHNPEKIEHNGNEENNTD
jgi:hypothetical protein